MLRIHQSSSVKAAQSYFCAELSRGRYYDEGKEAGLWFGKAAKMLGLEGEVKREDFHLLCKNRRPDTLGKLNPRDKEKRKVGYDLTYSAPKGVSLAFSILQDARILEVFRESVRETMGYVERDVHVRVRKAGTVDVRKTGNMLWSEFVHYETRPNEDSLTEPSLHIHAYTQNTSFDSVESKFKAGDFYPIVRDAKYFEGIFHSRLAQGLKELGYQIENKPFSFDIVGIGEGNIKRFSSRTKEIEALAKKLGISGNAKAMSKLGAISRKSKKAENQKVNKLAEWRSKFDWDEVDLEQTEGTQPVIEAQEAVSLAIKNLLERNSVAPLRRIVGDALQNSLGDCSFEEIVAEIRRNGELIVSNIEGVAYATTKTVLAEEKYILNFLKETKSSSFPVLGWYREKPEGLDADQCDAIKAIMTSRDRVICIQGRAGSGKTTMMSTSVKKMEDAGQRVFVFAPSSQAAHQVLKNEGFEDSETVQQLLVNPKLQEQMDGKILWIDEAGLLSTKEMSQLMIIAEEQNCRLVFSGDSRQHKSVGRGSAFKLCCDSGLVMVQETRSVYRQRSEVYKKAVTALSIGDSHEAFEILDGLGAIREIENFDERLEAVAKEYVESLSAYNSVLVVSPTHAEGRLVTGAVRELMREKGMLGEQEVDVPVYRSKNLTDAQRQLAIYYEVGDTIRFHQNAKGSFSKSDLVRVVRKNELGVFVQKFGETEELFIHPDSSRHFDVLNESQISISVGDKVRITRNTVSSNGKRIYNGNLHKVTDLNRDGKIMLDGKYEIPIESGLLDYGIVSTSYASQGKTADKVIVSQSGLSFDASSLSQFYVSVSRGRDSVVIMTDSRAGLLDAVSDSSERILAMDLERYRAEEENIVTEDYGLDALSLG